MEKADATFKDLESLYQNNFEQNQGLIEVYNLDISFDVHIHGGTDSELSASQKNG